MSNQISALQENPLHDMLRLQDSISSAESILNHSYLSSLSQGKISACNDDINNLNNRVRFFDISQIVMSKSENMLDKLSSIFYSVWSAKGSILLYIESSREITRLLLGIKNTQNMPKQSNNEIIEHTSMLATLLEKNLQANFPGTKAKSLRVDELENISDSIQKSLVVACVSDVAALRNDDISNERVFIQGIERLIDALRGHEYSLLLVADSVSMADLQAAKRALENLHSSLTPYSSSQYTYGENDSLALNESISKGITETITQSITDSLSHTTGSSFSSTDSTTTGKTRNNAGAGALIGGGIGATIGGAIGGPAGAAIGAGIGSGIGSAIGASKSVSTSQTHSTTHSTNESTTTSQSKTQGTSSAESSTQTQGQTSTTGSNRSFQIAFENHSIKRMLEQIESTLKRYDECADLGMYNCAMYCLSGTHYVAQMAASSYQSLIRGKNSSLINGAINLWEGENAKQILHALRNMAHPKLELNNGQTLTPGVLISSKELAIHAGLPHKSVAGIPVIECAAFGRNIAQYESPDSQKSKESIELGNIYHMQSQEQSSVRLDSTSLCSHTFITGSTGSGKSNTIYTILQNLPSKVKFLIIEPAKGEYKEVFGGRSDVSVYGTNPKLSQMLQINPFSFPKEIHILEHLDRLVEIFNVCWAMYAAMPAILKEAVEQAYRDCGWDLVESSNSYGENLYPSFADVARNVEKILNSSQYSDENKGNYKGALLTRLRSLTNGINGLIFNANELENAKLFDENVIIDLSRVGSSETKSLLMGILVLKLQEYRISTSSGEMNAALKHITVLEEAHNLLKRTSTEQSSESANLIGKSVEMLSNAIAEMRSYGEGFIIADQAPALLDMAAIRNTNTKIIMRLPDLGDRELVGRAANLNEEQIIELARLPKGVAAVYQNEWIESVLCKVAAFNNPKPYIFEPKKPLETSEKAASAKANREFALELAKRLFSDEPVDSQTLQELNQKMQKLKLSASSIVGVNKILSRGTKELPMTKLSPIIAELFPNLQKAMIDIGEYSLEQWDSELESIIKQELDIAEQLLLDIKQCLITDYTIYHLNNEAKLYEWHKLQGANSDRNC